MGRRRPFLLAGVVPAAVSFYLLLTPPAGTGLYIFLWLAVMSSIMVTSLTIFGIPYLALSWELSPDYNERTRISGWRRVFEVIAEILATLTIPVLIAISAAFKPPAASGLPVEESDYYSTAGLILGTVIVAAALLAVRGTPEQSYSSYQASCGFIKSIRTALKNRPFLILLVAFTFVAVADRTATAMLFYLLEHLHGIAKQDAVPLFLIFFAGSLASPPAWIRLTQSLGKKHAYLLAMVFWALAFGMFAAASWPPAVLYAVTGLMGAASSGVLILPGAIIPDVIEWEQVHTGERREGIYAGVAKFSWKIATSLGFLVVGHLLYLVGYSGESQPTAAVLQGLQWVFVAMISTLVIAAAAVFSRFRISSSVHSEHLRQLTQRQHRSGDPLVVNCNTT